MMAESLGAQEETARRCGPGCLGEEGTWEMRPCRWVRGRRKPEEVCMQRSWGRKTRLHARLARLGLVRETEGQGAGKVGHPPHGEVSVGRV